MAPADIILLVHLADGGVDAVRSRYRLDCPGCGGLVDHPAPANIVAILVAADVAALYPPAGSDAHPEAPVPGPELTPADLEAFRDALSMWQPADS